MKPVCREGLLKVQTDDDSFRSEARQAVTFGSAELLGDLANRIETGIKLTLKTSNDASAVL